MALFKKNKINNSPEESFDLFGKFEEQKMLGIQQQVEQAGGVNSQEDISAPSAVSQYTDAMSHPAAQPSFPGGPHKTEMIMGAANPGYTPPVPVASSTPGSLVGTSIVIGMRTSQQDSIAVTEEYVTDGFTKPWLGVLCDGMGGMNGGERASSTGVRKTIELFSKAVAVPNPDIPSFYQDLIAAMDYDVSSLEDESGRYLGAGTTFISVTFCNNLAYWASVGDSHIYVIRNGAINMIVKEHNYFQDLLEMVSRNEISMEEALSDKSKDALTSYIGMGGVSLMEINPGAQLMPGDIFILCSDGLYRALSDKEILDTVLRNSSDMAAAASALTALALSKNNPYQDNTSVITVKYQ